MLFCGIEKVSLNDYPGKISCVLFTAGCNFFCPYCHNPRSIIVSEKDLIGEEYIFHFINKRKFLYDGIAISGGEPTIREDIIATCKRIKAAGFKVKLDTNGSRPEVLKQLLVDKLVDYVAMDIKTKIDDDSYKKFTAEPNVASSINESISLIMDKAADYEFRTTCVKPFIDKTIIKNISTSIKDAKRYTLQKFNSYALEILDKNFMKDRGKIIENEGIDELVNVACSDVRSCGTSTIA